MEIETITTALDECIEIIRKHNEELDKDGSRFNIFDILGLTSSEERLHSNIIAELLKNDGTHAYKSKFFLLFLETLKEFSIPVDDTFDKESYNVEVEKTTGVVTSDYENGGRIDLIITDRNGKSIIIENKIYAGDQQKQLLRYHKFAPNALLLYLTLDGKEPSDWSTNGIDKKLEKDKDYHCISYKTFIKEWLTKCEITAQKPKVKETISQYKQTVDNLTENSNYNKMINKLAEIISANKDLYEAIETGNISEAFHSFRRSIHKRFWDLIRKEIPNNDKVGELGDYELKYDVEEDPDDYNRFYYGFYVVKNNEPIKGNSEELKTYAEKLKENNSKFKFFTNERYLGWTYSSNIKDFWNENLFELQKDDEMKKLTDKLVQEFSALKDEVKQRLEIK